MTWTRTHPTRHGWYWRRTGPEYVAEVVFVNTNGYVYSAGDAEPQDVDPSEWFGPLEEPEGEVEEDS
jgi:hypothetical protein